LIILRATGDLLKVQATTTGSDIEVHVSAMEADNATPPVIQDIVRTNTAHITDTTNTTVLDCTTANRRRNVKHINIFNAHASVGTVVTVTHTDGTTIEVLAKANLLIGESLVFTEGGFWVHYDSNGAPYPSVGNAASQAEMEAGTATDRFVTPQGVNWHPGACKFWCNVTGGGSPALQASWNVTSIADTNTGRMTVTIATDFSSANWCCSITTFTTTTTGDEGIPNIDSKAAGTIEAGNRIVTPAFGDPNIGYDVCGFGDQ
jgi:hypothetical protein